MTMRKAERRQMKIKIAIAGTAGAGKTFGALRLAYGLVGDWDKICLVDTEHYSGNVYANYDHNGIKIGEYYIISIDPPYTTEKYIAAIKECKQAGIECIIIDSLTHAWAGEGGILEQKDAIDQRTKGNSYANWRKVNPLHDKMLNTILGSNAHIICTLRSKSAYEIEKDETTGKTAVKKLGTKSIQKEDLDFEFTVFARIEHDHLCTAVKDQTSLFDGRTFFLDEQAGMDLRVWNEGGSPGTDYMVESAEKESILVCRRKFNQFIKTFPGDQDDAVMIAKEFIRQRYFTDDPSDLSLEQWEDLTASETLQALYRFESPNFPEGTTELDNFGKAVLND